MAHNIPLSSMGVLWKLEKSSYRSVSQGGAAVRRSVRIRSELTVEGTISIYAVNERGNALRPIHDALRCKLAVLVVLGTGASSTWLSFGHASARDLLF